MGAAVSGFTDAATHKSQDLADATKARNQALFKALENRVEAMQLQIEKSPGNADEVSKTEVSGGRTVMRVTEIRAANSTEVDKEIMDGIGDFLTMATGAKPANAAVKGTKKLLGSGVNALLGASSGESREKTSFMCLFLGNAFARIDYKMYSYSVTAKQWGTATSEAGFCYVADVAILKEGDVSPEEASYLISQSFDTSGDDKEVSAKEADAVGDMMLHIALLQRLQAAVNKPDATMEDLKGTIEQYNTVKKLIQDSMAKLTPYERQTTPPAPAPAASPAK